MAQKRPLLYGLWSAMKKRCYNPNVNNFDLYGGRGIRVSKEWLTFNNFNRDMLPAYKKGLFLERINNDGDYCKDNCKWATKLEQANNTRTNRFIIYKGLKKTLAQWTRFFNLKGSTVRQRFYVYKFPLDKVFEQGGQIGR